MGFIRRAMANTLSWPQLDPTDDRYWTSDTMLRTRSGVPISAETALTIAAVYAAVRLLSSTVGMIPAHIYRRVDDEGSKALARTHPVEEVIGRRPNSWQIPMEWRELMETHRQLVGNAYSEIVPSNRLGMVGSLVPRNPNRMRVEPTMRGDEIIYIYTDDDGRERRIQPEKMFHLRGPSLDGVTGMSTIAYARESLGLTLATEEHGQRSFGQGTRLSGVLQTEQEMKPQAIRRLASDWKRTYGGVENTGKVAILEQGLKWQSLSMTSEDAQFLESRKFQVGEIARWFGIPPHLIGDLERATFSNIEQQQIEYVVYAVMRLLTSWEQRITRSLITRDDVYFAEFTVDGLLRGDIGSRYQAYATGRQWGWMSANDIRRRENMNPIDDGDIYLQPLNMVRAGRDREESLVTRQESEREAELVGSNGHAGD